MQSIILSLASRYALSPAEVIQEIESAFARQLSRWYRQEVMVFFREDTRLEVVAYRKKNGLPVQHIIDLPAVLSRNQFTTILENHLATAAVIKQVRLLKGLERRLLWGEVIRNRACDHLLVETEIIPDETIIAICPLNRIGLHERHAGRLQPGQRRAFHLRWIEPVLVNGTPRTKVVLDRVSKTLTENLLRHHLGDLEQLKEKIDYIDSPEAKQLSLDIQKILSTPADYYSKVASSLRVALTELTSGNVGKIIGKADENRFIQRLEEGKSIILVVQLGSLLTKRAAYTAGKVIISMIQAFVGRVYSLGMNVTPSLVLHIDEAQSVLYQGIEDLFAKAGGAGVFIHGYCQSISQLYAEVGEDRANTILDNCNTKLFMRVPDPSTANYVSEHLGEEKRFSPIISLGGNVAIRETEEVRIKASEILKMKPRELFLITYSGTYKGVTADVEKGRLKVVFPGKAHRACAIALNQAGKLVKEAEVAEMKSVFDNPTRYTLNSLQLTPATKTDLKATVWFKEPDRMGAHYLVPQVDGGQRKLKGFERAIGEGELVPALGAKLNQYGNVSPGQIRQILSVLGKAETSAGYSANITDRSRRRNTKERDYVVIDRRQRGNLPLGVYQRFQTGAGFGAKTKRTFLDRSKSYQKGRTRGRFASVIRARGLRPVLLAGRTGHKVKPLLDFYGVAHRTFNQRFEPLFWDTLNRFRQS